CKPSPSTSPWPDVHLPNLVTIPTPSIRQHIAVYLVTLLVYLVGSSMPTLDSWLRHLQIPSDVFFSYNNGVFTLQCLFLCNFKKNLSIKKSNKQLFFAVYLVGSSMLTL